MIVGVPPHKSLATTAPVFVDGIFKAQLTVTFAGMEVMVGGVRGGRGEFQSGRHDEDCPNRRNDYAG